MISTAILKNRAEMLSKTRTFFAERNVLEVDCCALSPYAAIDSNIDVISAQVFCAQTGYLHTSPEYAMKRLLASGSGDIFYLGHVFRQGEKGRLHNPEFTMAEWYRLGFTFDQIIQETCDLLALFLGEQPVEQIGYREAFEVYVQIDPARASALELRRASERLCAAALPSHAAAEWSRDTLIHFLLTHAIEPHLGRKGLSVLLDYPPHEAALACVIEKNGERVAQRFEVYHQGVELANGYCELADSTELRRRFHEENSARLSVGKAAYALDEAFLAALPSLPPCCGVALGFDRAFLLRHASHSLAEVLPFSWPL